MIETFQIADWVLCGMAVLMAVTGLFRGFSGTLAFLLAISVAGAVAVFAWPYSLHFTETTWTRGVGVLVVTLLAFGLVRMVVKKLVNGLLSQPTDAVLGFFVGAAFACLIVISWAMSGIYTEFSTIVTEVARHVR